ncbi:MAG: Gfo/Idh/MocA family oxidoreductase [Bacteroidales bacterium]|nr:Gfo/Idh/MocA family oxidoreductase [Bacteroidales bacterium]
MRIGIIGAGSIASKMADTIQHFPEMRYAVASRDLARARTFADQWGFEKAYGAYEELVTDGKVDLVYVATPHSHHLAHASLAIEHGKAVLCEKAFTANARQAKQLINMARQRGVFLMEAMWTRFMPLSQKIGKVLESGVIGEPRMLSASLCYEVSHKARVMQPELCGGALLDLGVYGINFARMYFGGDIKEIHSSCVKSEVGIDLRNNITFVYADGKMATISSAIDCASDRRGVIYGDKGYLVVDNINNPRRVEIFDKMHKRVLTHVAASRTTGYEHEIFECENALRLGRVESPTMTHAETYTIMRLMDYLRKEWGVVFPMDSE